MHFVMVGVRKMLEPATTAEEHSLDATDWQATWRPDMEAEQADLIVRLHFLVRLYVSTRYQV